ncbi:hypothetical protein F7725_015213 [Dissostichus mawsoni]|uniref:Uncharacterized protein n=1 Tax=Dissostichus mawsoni TaxID=36200 RepID=A0A7J5YGT6_DISMA|nr:hypothetical protein F7725_015213 [Dissostichus mawsoni]
MGPSPQTSPRATVPIRARLSKARTRFQQRSRSSVFALRAETRAETRDDRVSETWRYDPLHEEFALDDVSVSNSRISALKLRQRLEVEDGEKQRQRSVPDGSGVLRVIRGKINSRTEACFQFPRSGGIYFLRWMQTLSLKLRVELHPQLTGAK